MEIRYGKKKLARACNEFAKANREWGPERARKVFQRLGELRAVGNLLDYSRLPGTGFHPLHHNREGQFAVELNSNWRLVFRPLENPIPCLPDGGVDLEKIAGTLIMEVVDCHGD